MATNLLTKDQIEDLLLNVLESPKIARWKGDRIQFCCTVHGEINPSAGIHSAFETDSGIIQTFHCFACGAKGSLATLVLNSNVGFKSYSEVAKFFRTRYGVEIFQKDEEAVIKKAVSLVRYEDYVKPQEEKRHIEPKYRLLDYHCGEQTFKYFFSRGFTSEDMLEYQVGYDSNNKTVVIPVFWQDKKLAGFIGRYISKNRPKNARFKIYDFPKSSVLYPLDKLEVVDDTIILVEAIFDSILLRKWGYKNVLAIMGDSVSKEQYHLLSGMCTKVLNLFDNDKGGEIAKNSLRRYKGLNILSPTYYPKEGKDVGEWGEKETRKVIKSCYELKLKRY